jgi:uncharacterized protein DUF4386
VAAEAPRIERGVVLAGGLALVLGAIGFLGVFAYLAARFHYPDVLDGNVADVLPALLATGDAGRAAWAFYAILPLIWLPAGVGAFEALRDRAEGWMRLAMLFAVVAAVSMMLGLMRWPSIHWELARAWASADASDRVVLGAVFDGLNRYLGNFIGEFLGELCVGMYFVLSGMGLLRHPRAPRSIGWAGVATGVLGLVGMWRNVTPAVAAVAEVNNYLLPLWMLVFGGWLLSVGRAARSNSRSVEGT